MDIFDSTKTAFNGLRANKFRSALTILGIVIGIAAIILIASIGEGAQKLILNQVQGIGSNTIGIAPGRQPEGLSDFAQIFSDSLKEKDLQALKQKANVPNAEKIMPIVFGGEAAAHGTETYRLTIMGGSELLAETFDIFPSEGSFFTDEDIQNFADVIVIGAKVKEELFGESEALNQKIRIRNRNFRVIGVLPKVGQISFFNFDDTAFIPYSTAQQYVFGIKYFHRFIIEAESESVIPQTVQDIKMTLRESHNITDPDKDDFFVETQVDIAKRLSIITDILTLFLMSIAAISLVVGGVGIMNIMLVSVSERTKEIGLRKAIGATDGDILRQFLFEAVILTFFGGIIGIAAGTFLSFITSLVLSRLISLGWEFTFPVQAVLIGVGTAALVGLVFGLYPARQAAKKEPIEALRYE